MHRLTFYFMTAWLSLLLASSATSQSIPFCNTAPPPKILHPSVIGLNFSRDGRVLASANADLTAKLWDMKTGRVFRTFTGHTNTLYKAIFSPDEKLLATSSRDYTARIWDVASGRELHTLVGHTCAVKSVAFSPDGKTLASVSNDRTVKLWDVKTGAEKRSLLHWKSKDSGPSVYADASVYSVVFSRDGRGILTGNGDGTISTWDVATGREVKIWKAHKDAVMALTFSRDKRLLASAGYGDLNAKFWDPLTGREVRTIADKKIGNLTEQLVAIAFSPNGKLFAASELGIDLKQQKYIYIRCKVWEVATGKELFTVYGHKFDIDAVVFTPDGKQLVTGSVDTTIKFWDVKTGREVRTFTTVPPKKNE